MTGRWPAGAWTGPSPSHDEDGNELVELLRPCFCESCREHARWLHRLGQLDVRYYEAMVRIEEEA